MSHALIWVLVIVDTNKRWPTEAVEVRAQARRPGNDEPTHSRRPRRRGSLPLPSPSSTIKARNLRGKKKQKQKKNATAGSLSDNDVDSDDDQDVVRLSILNIGKERAILPRPPPKWATEKK